MHTLRHIQLVQLVLLLVFLQLPVDARSEGERGFPPEVLRAQAPYDQQVPERMPRSRFASESFDETSDEDQNVFLWDGFEDDQPGGGWSIDSSADPASVTISTDRATQGKASLRVEPRFGEKGWVLVRRGTKLKLPGLRSVMIDAYASEAGLRLSFAYKDTGGGWHQSRLTDLDQGWNRDIKRTVDDLKTQKTETAYYGRKDEAQEFYIVIDSGPSETATLYLDNLRFEGTPTGDWHKSRPDSLEVYQPQRGVGLYHKFEIGVQFEGAYGNLFNPDDALVEVDFTSPEGNTTQVHGFFAGYADSKRFGSDWPIFLVRFAPSTPGRWTYRVNVSNPEGKTTGQERWFYVTDSDARGFVRTSRQDPRFFEFSNGDFYYPIGQNVAWAQDYEAYFTRQRETGQNWVRIWMCPWNLQLEKEAGRYDLKAATRLDEIVQLARQEGLRIQLVFIYHGMLTGESWGKNPYNWENDGPCYLASDFFTNQRARNLFKRRLRYIVARWGYSTNIMAWELFNEVDLARYSRFGDVVKWHREMSDYVKEIDPHDHLVTTSLSRKSSSGDLWNLTNIDFMPLHVYDPDFPELILNRYRDLRSFKKPWFVAEYGRSTELVEMKKDTDGRDLRDALWASFMVPIAGNVMPWWWDSYIKPHELNRLFGHLSRFAEGVDRRNQDYRLIETAILREQGGEVAVRGLLNNRSCYLWFRRSENDEDTGEEAGPLIPAGQDIALSGMLGGKYGIMVLDIQDGRILRRSVLTSQRGRLTIPLARSNDDIAVRVMYQGDATPRFYTSPELMRVETERREVGDSSGE